MNFKEKLPKYIFVLVAIVSVWVYGVLSQRYQLFPYRQLDPIAEQAKQTILSVLQAQRITLPWWYVESPRRSETVRLHGRDRVSAGYTLVTGISKDNELLAKVIDVDGRTIHKWDIDWFKLWPDPNHLDEEDRPKSKPTPYIHGFAFMKNGDFVFNFEGLGLIRLDICGRVIWRLPYRTHHSLHLDESGNFWIGGQIVHKGPVKKYPNLRPPFHEYTVLEVSQAGKILSEISVLDLLLENGLKGLLYMPTTNNMETLVGGDLLHLNDVETFPSRLQEGFFRRGDIMISLRNISAILVFDGTSRRIKYLNMGNVLRQHDPDFIDGNRISVLDNNNERPGVPDTRSRIVVLNADGSAPNVLFEGSSEKPFSTYILGKHQYLPNGNILVTESMKGRAFELTPEGEVVWEYFNLAEPGLLGMISEAQRLSPKFDEEFFRERTRACKPRPQTQAARPDNSVSARYR